MSEMFLTKNRGKDTKNETNKNAGTLGSRAQGVILGLKVGFLVWVSVWVWGFR